VLVADQLNRWPAPNPGGIHFQFAVVCVGNPALPCIINWLRNTLAGAVAVGGNAN